MRGSALLSPLLPLHLDLLVLAVRVCDLPGSTSLPAPLVGIYSLPISPGPGEEIHQSIQFENEFLHLLFFVRPAPDVGMTARSTPLSAVYGTAVGTEGLSLWVRPRDRHGCALAVATGEDQDISADT